MRRAYLLWLIFVLGCAAWAAASAEDTAAVRRCALPAESDPDPTPVGNANRALADGRWSEARSLFEAIAADARRAGNAAQALLAEAGALRARVRAEQSAVPWELFQSALSEIAALEHPSLAARLRLHFARSAILQIEHRRSAPDAFPAHIQAVLRNVEQYAKTSGDLHLASLALGDLATIGHLTRSTMGADASPPEPPQGEPAALQLARRALFLAQQVDDAQLLFRWQGLIGRIHRETGHLAEARDSYRSAVLSLDLARKRGLTASAPSDIGWQRERDAVFEALVDLLLREAEGAADGPEQALLLEARGHLEARRAAELSDHFRDPCLEAHRRAVPDEVPGALLVYPVLLPDRLELIASRGGRMHHFSAPVTRAQLDETVHRFRRLLEKRTSREYLRDAATLHEWLIDPLLDLIDDPGTRNLVFVPEGSLRTIPISALRDGIAGRYLIERIPVSVSPVLTLTDPDPFDITGMRVLSAGLSEATAGFVALPAVKAELSRISTLLPGEALLDEAFERSAFTRALREYPYEMVHIASHGEFRSDTRESFLLAHDEPISIDELATTLAATRFRGRGVELLTLSACQTAAGDERAALGLAGVAVRSGARSAVASLWNIDDAVASELVTRFYAQLKKPGVSRSEALQRAQRSILEQPAHAHAGDWSALLLIGNWM